MGVPAGQPAAAPPWRGRPCVRAVRLGLPSWLAGHSGQRREHPDLGLLGGWQWSQDSCPTRNLGNLNRCGATEWVVGTGGSTDSCREDSSLGESNEGSERKEGEHLCRTEELVFPKEC